MKKLLIACCVITSLASCNNNYGTKHAIAGTKSELYYKEGITETEAINTAAFLKREYIQDDKASTMQLTKENDVYTLRLVYDKAYYDTLKNADNLFKAMGVKASKEVFAGKKVTIALADESMKDFKTLPYDEALVKLIDTPADPQNRGYDHDVAGGINFYWKDISDDESKTIAEYIVKNGAFAGGKAEIYINKENSRYVLRFPMIASALTDPTYISEVDKVSRQIKENVFANQSYSFIATNEQLETVKKWDY